MAEATGLSQAAVSYALRGLQVPVETQERVRDAARELGYEVNPIARALASGRTGTVGVLCGSLEDLWQQGLAVALSRALLAQDRYAIIADANGDPAREVRMVRQLREQQVDGVIVFPLDPVGAHWADLAAAVPVVAIGDALARVAGAGRVLFDNKQGIRLAMEHLAGKGHRRIAVFTPSLPSTPERPAELLAISEAERLGLDISLDTSPASVSGAADAAHLVLGADDPPTAVFCQSDSMAYGVYLAAQRLGLTIPDDVSVLGYDDHQMSELLSPPLTTFGWDVEGIVLTAVDQLVAAIDDDAKFRRAVFEPTLRERGSTGPPRR